MSNNSTLLGDWSLTADQENLIHLSPVPKKSLQDISGSQEQISFAASEQEEWVDKQRYDLLAYEYLCHVEEAKQWIQDCLEDKIEETNSLEESLQSNYLLSKLAESVLSEICHQNELSQTPEYQYSDNIEYFFNTLEILGLPKVFWFDPDDLYQNRNISNVIYCIHALSHLLSKKGLMSPIKSLLGQLHFTNEDLSTAQHILDSSNSKMPDFLSIDAALRRELNDKENTEEYHLYNNTLFDFEGQINEDFSLLLISTPSTPDLVVEDYSDSDLSPSFSTFSNRNERHWSKEENIQKLRKCQSQARSWLEKKKASKTEAISKSESPQHLDNKHTSTAEDKVSLKQQTVDEEFIIKLQSASRRYLSCIGYQRIIKSYRSNVKAQSFAKNKVMGNAYRKLSSVTNPSIDTVRTYIHLLDDDTHDFEREIASEELSQKLIENIRENNQLDTYINSLDIQIALFLKNAISIDEVLKHSGAFKKKKEHQRRLNELTSKNTQLNPFALTGIDKESRQRLETYQKLVYLLQTEPKYLARLLSMTNRQDLGHFSSHRLIESTVLSVFGYATNAREEYLLINLCKYCIAEEMKDVASTQEFMRGNYTFMKLVVQTNRGAKEREFFRTLLSPLVNEVVHNDFLDLEIDPVSIYHKAINDEESRTGMPSSRPHAVTSQDALSDSEVRDTFVVHLRNLREITEKFFSAIISTVDTVPYGIRVVARELRLILEENFLDEPHDRIIKIIGNFIYYRYLNPAIVAPEQYDVIDAIINPIQRKNLAEVSKMLQHISSGSVFSDVHDIFLAPLNDYVADAGRRFAEWFMALTDVEEPESYFGVDALTDQTSTHKPIVFISPSELFHLHYTIQNNLDSIEPEGSGILHDIINEIGPSIYRPDIELPESMVCLTLTNRHDDIPMDPGARLQQLLVETKRLVSYVIKIQSGPNLDHILRESINQEYETEWGHFKSREFSSNIHIDHTIVTKRRHLKLGQTDTPIDLQSISFSQLKSIVNRLLIHLERCKVIANNNRYQDIVNMIASDITGKNARRLQRRRELERMRQTLEHLNDKKKYLLEQGNQYEDYLASCMNAMATKKGKKAKFVFPFTRQYFHIKGLQKQGAVPTFGSYKYTAKQLHERGILLELVGISKKHYDSIPIILSMDQAGVITIEGSYSGWSLSSVQVDIRYEELLQTQFEGVQSTSVLDGMAKANVNLLIYLINKKFYA